MAWDWESKGVLNDSSKVAHPYCSYKKEKLFMASWDNVFTNLHYTITNVRPNLLSPLSQTKFTRLLCKSTLSIWRKMFVQKSKLVVQMQHSKPSKKANCYPALRGMLLSCKPESKWSRFCHMCWNDGLQALWSRKLISISKISGHIDICYTRAYCSLVIVVRLSIFWNNKSFCSVTTHIPPSSCFPFPVCS